LLPERWCSFVLEYTPDEDEVLELEVLLFDMVVLAEDGLDLDFVRTCEDEDEV
jgi:hypothetical protein